MNIPNKISVNMSSLFLNAFFEKTYPLIDPTKAEMMVAENVRIKLFFKSDPNSAHASEKLFQNIGDGKDQEVSRFISAGCFNAVMIVI